MKLTKFVWCVGVLLASVLVAQAQQDITPPNLAGFDFSPKQVDTSSGPATITVSFHLTDNLSGSIGAYAIFRSPSGNATQYGSSYSLFSGTILDGLYQGQFSLPA